MIVLLRALVRLTGFLLLAILAVAGLVVALGSLLGGIGLLSATDLAALVHAPNLRDTVGTFLRGLESAGSVAALAALSGAGAILAGLALLAGAVIPRRERLLVIEKDGDGTLTARRRAATQAIRAVAEQNRDVRRAKARIRPRRTRSGGRLRVTVYRAQSADQHSVLRATTEQLAPLAQSLSLRVRTRSRVPKHNARVR